MSFNPKLAAEKFLEAQPIRMSLDQYTDTLQKMGRFTRLVSELAERADSVRSANDLVFYLAGPLTGMPEEVKSRYELTSKLIGSHDQPPSIMFGYAPHLHGTDPIKNPDVDPDEVRDIDNLFAVIAADGHINFWDPTAHGNAIEEGWAEPAGIPSLYVVSEDVSLSRLPKGMWNIAGTVLYKTFEDDGIAQLSEFFDAVQAGRAD